MQSRIYACIIPSRSRNLLYDARTWIKDRMGRVSPTSKSDNQNCYKILENSIKEVIPLSGLVKRLPYRVLHRPPSNEKLRGLKDPLTSFITGNIRLQSQVDRQEEKKERTCRAKRVRSPESYEGGLPNRREGSKKGRLWTTPSWVPFG